MRKGGYGFQGQLIRKTGMKKRSILIRISNPIRILRMVGVTGLEPMASWSRTKRSTKLSYTPMITQTDSQKTMTG